MQEVEQIGIRVLQLYLQKMVVVSMIKWPNFLMTSCMCSSCFAGVYYKLESSILLPPPNSDEILDADQVKRQYVKARAILAKVCFFSFYY